MPSRGALMRRVLLGLAASLEFRDLLVGNVEELQLGQRAGLAAPPRRARRFVG